MVKTGTILLTLLILAAVAATGVSAKGGGPDNGMGLQVQNQSQIQDRLSDEQNPIRNQTQDQERVRDRIQVEQTEQVRLQNQTRAMNVTLLHQQLQERIQEQEHAGRSPDQQRVFARYSNVSAFVHLLLNESRNNAMLGEGPGGIGPQVSEFARQFNNSLQVQLQAEERIGNRNGIARFLSGGDAEAAGTLEQETIRNQERIQAMQRLINQCQDCDGQIKEMLQEQLQNMEAEQSMLLQLAQRERQDKGIFGWFQR